MKNTACCLVLILAPALARAHDAEVETTKAPYELTGYVGYQTGGDFDVEGTDEDGHVNGQVVYGLAMNFRTDSERQYQVFYSRQPAHIDATSAFPNGIPVDIDYLHFGGTLLVDPGTPLEPYIVGSLGATLLSPQFTNSRDKDVFSIGIGAGLRVPVSKQFNVLLEARAFFSFMPSGGALFCGSGQNGAGCRIQGSGSVFAQYAFLAGAAYAF